jgi:pimeloyl-ACP methyl ester carboxylesterase
MSDIMVQQPQPAPAGTRQDWEDLFFRSHDDLILYARCYGGEDLPGRTTLCLAGITRNSKDFHDLALALSRHPTQPRRVYCLDYRGRGRSQYDANWRNYSPFIELLDVIALLTAQELSGLALIGTSRGGLIAMLLGVVRPSSIGCAVLNDIGPVIETAGLARILGYAGKIPLPRDWAEATRVIREINKAQFPMLDEASWRALAHQWFSEENGLPAASYDPNVGKALSEVDISKPMPEMWAHFEALAVKPVLVLRGENSDILSQRTLQEMHARDPDLQSFTLPNEGHAPLLRDPYSQRLIADFLIEQDGSLKK